MKTLSSYKQFAKHIVLEADKSDDYVHIGYGKYKEKDPSTGEAKADSPVYSKDDSGNFTSTSGKKGDKKGGEKGGEEVPDSQKISGAGEFERPKDTKQDVDSDMYAQDTWDRYGDEEPPGKSSGIDDDPWDNLDNMFGDEDEDDLEDPAGGRGDAWMHGPTDDEKERPLGGSAAEAAYQKADMLMKKYAGVDIKKAEYWAKEKKKAADAMLPEHAFAEMFKRIGGR